METKINAAKFARLNLGRTYVGKLIVDLIGAKGGLALLWSTDIDIMVISYSFHHISVSVRYPFEHFTWSLVGFYGEPNWEDKWRS